ncbi:hypothetical protein FDENT_4195 [Fusarium denticulatum]|uniref:Uncharacterized protein n=1 Tax=Fusarium denticulatum TaxID=48507 RepID=A0A8H5XAF6_9HYPO|nr:hypothetical protein FDENT_4195 [Fusarium denticulatum]
MLSPDLRQHVPKSNLTLGSPHKYPSPSAKRFLASSTPTHRKNVLSQQNPPAQRHDPRNERPLHATNHRRHQDLRVPQVQHGRHQAHLVLPHRSHSAITHICPVNEAVTRNSGDAPLPEDGLGNKEYNDKDADYEGYDFAYQINAVYEIQAEGGRGITWAMMRDEHGMKIAPRGRVRVLESMIEQYRLEDQKKVL